MSNLKALTEPKHTSKVSMAERECGKRATFHVYYRDAKGKLRFDPSFEATIDAAVEGITSMLQEAYGRRAKQFVIVAIAPLDQSVSVFLQ